MKDHNFVNWMGDAAYCVRCRKWLNEDLQQLGCLQELLIELPLNEARERKYERGKIQHRMGKAGFVGDPLQELFEECLDAVTYIDELSERGFDLKHGRAAFVATALELQTFWRNRS